MWRVIAVVLGVWVGTVGLVMHRQVWDLGVRWPWGLVLALLTTMFVLRALATGPRLVSVWFLLGWAVVLLAPAVLVGDDFLVASDSLTWTWLLASAGLIVIDVVRASRVDS